MRFCENLRRWRCNNNYCLLTLLLLVLYLWLCNPTTLLLTLARFLRCNKLMILRRFHCLSIYGILLFVVLVLIFIIIAAVVGIRRLKVLVLGRIVVKRSRSIVSFILIVLCTRFLLELLLVLTLIILLTLLIVLCLMIPMRIILVIIILIYLLSIRPIAPTWGTLSCISSWLVVRAVTTALTVWLRK